MNNHPTPKTWGEHLILCPSPSKTWGGGGGTRPPVPPPPGFAPMLDSNMIRKIIN